VLDLIAMDGTTYHWANAEVDITPVLPPTLPGTRPAWLAGQAFQPANYDTHYYPWLLSAEGFHHYRSQESDTATIEIQDVSGNTLQRDMAGLIVGTSFEGALLLSRVESAGAACEVSAEWAPYGLEYH
jgi:hypothetical protein